MLFERANNCFCEWLESTGQDDTLLSVDGILNQNQGRNIVHAKGLGDLQIIDVVEKIQDIDITGVTNCTKQGRDEKLTTTTTTVEVNVEQIIIIELHFQPSATIRNDPERVKQLAVGMRANLEGNTR